jgi:hypothetical protein
MGASRRKHPRNAFANTFGAPGDNGDAALDAFVDLNNA